MRMIYSTPPMPKFVYRTDIYGTGSYLVILEKTLTMWIMSTRSMEMLLIDKSKVRTMGAIDKLNKINETMHTLESIYLKMEGESAEIKYYNIKEEKENDTKE